MIKYIIPFSIIIFCITSCGSEEEEVNEETREVKVSERSKAAANRRDPRSRRDSLYSEVNGDQENSPRSQSRETRTTGKTAKKVFSEGLNLSYHPSGELKSEVNYKNGKKDGLGKWYFKSGKLKYQGTWKNGIQEGDESAYYESLHEAPLIANLIASKFVLVGVGGEEAISFYATNVSTNIKD